MLHHRLHLPLRVPASGARLARRVGTAALLLTLLGSSLVRSGIPSGLLTSAHAQDAATSGAVATAPMAVEWKFTGLAYGGNSAGAVTSEDTIFYASGGVFYGVDIASGAQKWRYPATGVLPAPVLHTPAYSNGTLVLCTGEGVTALDAATGKTKYPTFVVPNGASTSPIVIGDTVYFGSGNGRIFALSVKTGDPLSGSFRNGLNLGVDITGNISTQDGLIYVITANQVLHAIDSLTGNQRWSVRLEGEVRGTTPVPAGEILYVATGSALRAFRAGSGVSRWTQPTPKNISAPPAVDSDGTAYIVTSDRAVYAIKPAGIRPESVWKKVVPQVDYNVSAQPVISGDTLFIATQGGGIFAYDRATGAAKWNYLMHPASVENATALPKRAGISAHPIVVGSTLFTVSDDGSLTAFRGDANDTTPPIITPLKPQQGDYVNGQPPFSIRANVSDEGSGLNMETMIVKIDENQIPMQKVMGVGTNGFLFDVDSGDLQYTIYPRGGNEVGRSTALVDGHHTVTVSVKDWKGNLATRSWSFVVDDTIKRATGTPAPGGFGTSGGGPEIGGGKGQ